MSEFYRKKLSDLTDFIANKQKEILRTNYKQISVINIERRKNKIEYELLNKRIVLWNNYDFEPEVIILDGVNTCRTGIKSIFELLFSDDETYVIKSMVCEKKVINEMLEEEKLKLLKLLEELEEIEEYNSFGHIFE